MILSYHLLPQQIFFTYNWNLSRHCCVFVCFLFVWFVFACVCFCFGSLCFGSCSLERDKGIGLCIGPLPVYFFRSLWLKSWLKAVSAQTPWVLGNLILTQGANIHLG